MIKKTILMIGLLGIFPGAVFGQEFEIRSYEIAVQVKPEVQQLEVKAVLGLANLSGPDLADKILLASANKPRLSFFLHAKAQVSEMKVNEVTVTSRSTEDLRNNLLRVSTEMTSSLASTRDLLVELRYVIPTVERSSLLHVSGTESFVLPGSFWVPVYHTPYAEHGTDTAPMKITISGPAGLTAVSSGIRKAENSFELSQAGHPFFLLGEYELVTMGGPATPVEVYYPRGSGDQGKVQAEQLATEAVRIQQFYADYFGVPALSPFRVVKTQARQLSTSTSDSFSQGREIALTTVGAVTVDDNLFRRDRIDQGTIELLANAAARAWIDGQVLLRGRGTGLLRDALPAYLVAQYLGERYEPSQRTEALERFRRAYSTIARNDAPLLMLSQLDRNYTTSIYNKGAMVWRLLEEVAGKKTLATVLQTSLSRNRVDVLSFGEWRSPLCLLARCASFKQNLLAGVSDRKRIEEIFSNWIESVVLPDFAVGQPQQVANGWESTVTNFGSGDVTIDVVATTETGEEIRRTILVKASEFGTVNFATSSRVVSVETDPEKLYLQSDYTNDQFPRRQSESEFFGLANVAFSRNEFETAEARARQGLAQNPRAATLQALLGRILLARNNRQEAGTILQSALKADPMPILAYGWAHQGLGELALGENRPQEALDHFRRAAAADLDATATVAARDGAIKAAQALQNVQIPDELRAFLQRFDAAILQSTAAVVNTFVEIGNLRRFAQSLVVRKPSLWVTEPLWAEKWDANRTAIDVTLKIRIDGKDYAGRAVYVISLATGSPILSEVPVFDVK
jgi:hypothetical protein